MGLRTLYATVRRDLLQVSRNLIGQRPPPYMRRERHGAVATKSFVVRDVRRETADAISIELARADGQPIAFDAGQFFTLVVDVGGERLRRAYSASSSAHDDSSVTVTVKRVAGGRVSNYLNDSLCAGATLEVLGPSGSFGPRPSREPRHLVLVAGGSGITPMMSILRTLLASEPATRFTLVYGNRSREDAIFHDALAELAGPQLVVQHVFGMLDELTCTREIPTGDDYYVCGPEPMMACVRAALTARGVAADCIHEERFFTPAAVAREPASFGPQRVAIRLRTGERQFVVPPGQTLLEAGLAAGAPMPFSCTMGGCAACKCRLVSGHVEMEEPNCLTAEERAAGDVLACVGRPTTAVVLEVA